MGQLFDDSVVPPNGDTDAPGWTLGSIITYSAGSPPAIRGRWYMRSGLTGSVGFRVYDATLQTLLVSANFPVVTTGWQVTDDFVTPLEVEGLSVVACVYTSASGHYPYELNGWGAGIPTSDGFGLGTAGRFHNADAWPQSGPTTTNYFVDLVTEAFGEAGIKSEEKFGSPSLTVIYTASPKGIITSEKFGASNITSVIKPAFVTSNEKFGQSTISTENIITAGGIPSAEVIGRAVLNPGAVTVAPGAIKSEEVFGSGFTGEGPPEQIINTKAINTKELFGPSFVGIDVEIDVTTNIGITTLTSQITPSTITAYL